MFSTKSCKCAPWKSIFSQKGVEDMDVVDEIRLKPFHSHGRVFIANEYRAIDRLYRSEEGCLRRDDCAADCAWWALKSSSLGLLCQHKVSLFNSSKKIQESKLTSLLYYSLYSNKFRSAQVSRMPPVVLDLEKPFEVRVELQGSHDDSSTTLGQG